MSENDRDLLRRLRAGEADARAELFRRCQDLLVPYFRTRLSDAADVEDCVSEVVVRALAGIGGLEELEHGSLDPWLRGVARNVLMERYRTNGRRGAELPEELPGLSAELEFLRDKRELWAALGAAVHALKPGPQSIMRAHLDLSLKHERLVVGAELAAALDMPVDRLDRQLSRARESTRHAIVSVVVARVAKDRCQVLRGWLNPEQRRADRELVLDPRQSGRVFDHAAGCDTCRPYAHEAGRYGRWAIGPGLLTLSPDDDEERSRAAAVLLRREPGGGPAAPPAAAGGGGVPVRLLRHVGDGVESAKRFALTQATRVPGLNNAIQLAQQNPVLARGVGVGAALTVGAAAVLLGTDPSRAPAPIPTVAAPSARPVPSAPPTPAPSSSSSPSSPSSSPSGGGSPGTTPSPSPSGSAPGVVPPPSPSPSPSPMPSPSPSERPTRPPKTIDPKPPVEPTGRPTPTGGPTPPPCTPVWRVDEIPQVTALNAVAGTSADDLWAVGADADRSAVRHWDGRSWRAVDTPRPGQHSLLTGVSAPARTLAWAVGRSVHADPPLVRPLLQRWDGTGWSETAAPGLGGGVAYLESVWAAGPQEVWAVGHVQQAGSQQALVLRWNGTSWAVAHRREGAEQSTLLDVTGSGSGDVWAVGREGPRPVLKRWDGDDWDDVAPPSAAIPGAGAVFQRVWAGSPTNVWVSGTYYDAVGNGRPLAAHYDGGSWRVHLPAVVGYTLLLGLAPDGGNGVWLFGGRDPGVSGVPLIRRWNGTGWSEPAFPAAPAGYLFDAVSPAPGRLWAVGWIAGPGGSAARALVYSHRC